MTPEEAGNKVVMDALCDAIHQEETEWCMRVKGVGFITGMMSTQAYLMGVSCFWYSYHNQDNDPPKNPFVKKTAEYWWFAWGWLWSMRSDYGDIFVTDWHKDEPRYDDDLYNKLCIFDENEVKTQLKKRGYVL